MDQKYANLLEAKAYLESNPKVECNPYPQYDGRIYSVLYSLELDTEYMEKHDRLAGKEISEMSLPDLSVMYTFICRSERFCDGSIMSYVEDGTLLKLLNRELELLGTEEESK